MRRVSSAALLANANVSVEANKTYEDIPDIDLNDVPAKLEDTLKPHTPSGGVSLFNLNLDEFIDSSSSVDEVQEHKERCEKEQQKWFKLVEDALKMTRESATREYSFEPREEQQRYLKECPNLQNFIRGSLPFMNKVTRFLEDHRNLVDLQDELTEYVQFQLNSKAHNDMHQNLAGKRPSR